MMAVHGLEAISGKNDNKTTSQVKYAKVQTGEGEERVIDFSKTTDELYLEGLFSEIHSNAESVGRPKQNKLKTDASFNRPDKTTSDKSSAIETSDVTQQILFQQQAAQAKKVQDQQNQINAHKQTEIIFKDVHEGAQQMVNVDDESTDDDLAPDSIKNRRKNDRDARIKKEIEDLGNAYKKVSQHNKSKDLNESREYTIDGQKRSKKNWYEEAVEAVVEEGAKLGVDLDGSPVAMNAGVAVGSLVGGQIGILLSTSIGWALKKAIEYGSEVTIKILENGVRKGIVARAYY